MCKGGGQAAAGARYWNYTMYDAIELCLMQTVSRKWLNIYGDFIKRRLMIRKYLNLRYNNALNNGSLTCK